MTFVTQTAGLVVFLLNPLFNVHILKFAGLEDLAAFLAFDELRFFIAAHDLDARVLTGLLHICGFTGGGDFGGIQSRTHPAMANLPALSRRNFPVF